MSDVLKEVLRDKERAERFRKWDTALNNILDDPYGQYLGYYPPVFIAKRCFDLMRPYFLQICSKSDTTNLIDNQEDVSNCKKISSLLGINPFGEDSQNSSSGQDVESGGQKSSTMNYEAAKGSGNDPVKSRYFDQSLINVVKKKNDKENPFDDTSSSVASSTITDPTNPFADTEKTSKPKKQSIMRRLSMKKKDKKEKKESLNPFDSGNGSTESTLSSQNDKKEQANGTETTKSPKIIQKILNPSFPKAAQNPKFLASLTSPPVVDSEETLYYPCDGSDIDSDNDSDAEGNYELNHDYDDVTGDNTSLKSAASIRSIKATCDEESRELQTKLIENYVTDKDKQKYKKSNSLKRIFSKKGKKEKKEQS